MDGTQAAAAVADLGTIIPITAALVVVNGIDGVAALVIVGSLFLASAFAYRVPVPVQPIKAAAAIAMATGAPAGVIAAAGLVLGAVMIGLAITGATPVLVRIFPKPIIRGNQLGVGLLLVTASAGLVLRMPGGPGASGLLVTAALVALLMAPRRKVAMGLAIVAGGVLWTLLHQGFPEGLALSPALPSLALPGSGQLALALTLLVVPQLPLTLGNAVVGTADLERDYFGARAARVTPRRLLTSSGLANLAAGALGGMPVCHGSSGLTAYKRFGARGGGVNLVAGGLFVIAGLLFGRSAPALFGLVPVPVLAALLAYTGFNHALLVRDQRAWALAVALSMGAVGGLTRNLAFGLVLGWAACGLRAAGPTLCHWWAGARPSERSPAAVEAAP